VAPQSDVTVERAHPVQTRLFWLVLLALLWVTRFTAPEHPGVPEIDPSWHQALGWGLAHGLQFGRDIVFTYGPLGWFAHSAWQPELFGWKLWFFEIAFKLAVCAFLLHAATRVTGPVERLLYVLLLLVPDPGLEAFFFVTSLVLAAWIAEDVERPPWRAAPVWLLLGVVACIKFTYLLLVVALATLVVIELARRRSVRVGLQHAVLCLGAILVVWCAAGQRPWNLPAYVYGGWQLSNGYTEAMSFPSDRLDVWLAVLALACGLASVLVSWRGAPRTTQLVRALAFAGGGFIAFKGGFVPNGTTTITCFGYAFLAPFVLARRDDGGASGARWLPLVRVLAVVLALWGYQRAQERSPYCVTRPLKAWNDRFGDALSELCGIANLPAAYDAERPALRAGCNLERVRALVGRQPIDVFHVELAALFLNDLEWRPRPVIQSYAAYTEALAERNAEHFRGERAPRFLLWRLSTLFDRAPGLDDAPALREVLRRYEPRFEEGGYLVLERRAHVAPPLPARTVLERTARMGERVELPPLARRGGVLHLDVRHTAFGALAAFLLNEQPPLIEIESSDGTRATFRLVRSEARAGLLVDPWLPTHEAWVAGFTGTAQERAVAFTVTFDPKEEGEYADEFDVRYEEQSDLLPPPDPELASALTWPMFDREPDALVQQFPFSRTTAPDSHSALLVHAPSAVVFDLAPGRWRVEAHFGIQDGAWTPPCTDGAVFVLGLRNARGEAGLWRRRLDPQTNEQDRGVQSVVEEFDMPAETSFALRTNVGASGHGSCDWCWWSDVRFTRLDAPAPPR
jgi:hypothetical protein